ncbi:MAG: valine--tRNA ligase [Candidatus Portnoybacteria bacterium]|nr:valine--tRNA ligase [Candidatus Portnoybacteria bacterium]MDD4982633.1 valine--tRNA ligase [Candidatus Portnoybacteria bacterium]
MEAQYDPKKVEDKIYRLWEESGFFNPDNLPDLKDGQKRTKPYCIIMPPPNANEALHLGHALMATLEDILIRYRRLRGDIALWLPGADHAGFETQVVFERKLEKQGKSRFQFDRETLYKMIWDYVEENKNVAQDQLKRLGASCDWSRSKFTLDPDIVKIVYQTFKKLYDDGLVYRGPRIINWCPKHQTGLSDLEVKYKDREDKLWYIKYPLVGELDKFIEVATTRPETMLGDSAVAVNPEDERYKNLVGKKVLLPLMNREITIVADEAVELKFGTGAVKVTPAHDATDFDIGQRHSLETISVIGQDDKMTAAAGADYAGLKVAEARKKIVEDLQSQGFLIKEEPYRHSVGVCYKCGRVIEPMVSEQWFVKIKPLAERAIEAVNKGEVKFISAKYEKIFQHWMGNIRDWNISRQIVWGIRIPVWYCIDKNCPSENYKKIKDNPALFKDKEDDCFGTVHHGEEGEPSVEHIIRRLNEGLTINESLKPFISVSGSLSNKPTCPDCNSNNVFQEKDTFDTWFSSGQWPFATLQTTKAGDFAKFYPTAVMETGWDILFFWVARMIMMGFYAAGKEPFKQVYLHGLIRDKDKQKMSKSKGNTVNPLAVVDENGADALRMALVFNAASDSDLPFSEDKVIAQKRFANKIWNAARFSISNLEDFDPQGFEPKFTAADEEILKELDATAKKITKDLDNFDFHEAAQSAYHFFWHSFCDKCIEDVKKRIKEPASEEDKKTAQFVLNKILLESLKLLHPFMPFITEEIYQQIPRHTKKALMVEEWPMG